MTSPTSARFVVTFTDKHDMEFIDSFADSFLGLGFVYRHADPRVMYVRTRPDVPYEWMINTLEELRQGGALTYVEDRGPKDKTKRLFSIK